MEADPDIGGRRELTERIAFAHTHNICLRTAREFERRGIGPKDFFSTDAATLCAISGCRPDVFNSARRSADLARAAKEAELIERRGIRAIYYTDTDYPRRLLECDDAPAMLYCIGTPVQAAHAVAIVGTRHSTPYGQSMVERLVSGLAEKIDDLVIVSGLAYGIDIAAHRAAMKAGIRTGAVLAHGLNTLYPPEHRSDAIAMTHAGGFLLTEYRSCDPTHRGNFLARNRIVAGMTDLTVVVESGAKGGAMTTARLAAAYQREVMAVPGRVFDTYSCGCNELIASSQARVLRDVDDIIEACCWKVRPQEGVQRSLGLEISDSQRTALHFLQDHPEATVNELAIALGQTIPRTASLLFEMEMSDLIVSLPGGRYGVTAMLG